MNDPNDFTPIEDGLFAALFKEEHRILAKGDRFGRYEVEAEIGAGSMGRVYRARDPLTRRTVAIKTMRTEYLPERTAVLYRRRFQVEAQAAGGLSHPNVVRIYDQGEDFLVMEHLDGTRLSQLVGEKRLSIEEALTVLSGIAAALDHAHAHGVVHRDVKPTNIMVLRDGTAKLMDFGLAQLPGETCVGDKFLGTPSYMAPEQILEGEATSRSDLFSFGVVAYETLTGQKPFAGENIGTITYRVVYEEPPSPTHLNPLLPASYDDVLGRMLAKDPSHRLPTAAAFVSALEAHRRHRTRFGNVRPDPPRPRPPEPDAPAPPSPGETQDLSDLVRAVLVDGKPGGLPELHLTSDPVGASVWVDGVRMGTTPSALSLAPGAHALRLMEDGFVPVQVTLTLPADGKVPSLHVTLEPTMIPGASRRREERPVEIAREIFAPDLPGRPS